MWLVLSERSWPVVSCWNCCTVRLATCVGFSAANCAGAIACSWLGVSCAICLLPMTVKPALPNAAVLWLLAGLAGEAAGSAVLVRVTALLLLALS